jgi:hypothetical protein
MSRLSEFFVRDELAVFPGIENDECYWDFLEISGFLANNQAVVKALGALEKRISDKAQRSRGSLQDLPLQIKSYFGFDSDLKALKKLEKDQLISQLTKRPENKPSYLKHLVSSCMTDMEVAHRFTVSGNRWTQSAQYYLSVVAADKFREQIKAGRPAAKDPYVDVGHGEYTHRLQWCAVMAASDACDLRLKNHVITVYRAVGKYAAPKGKYYGFRWGLWDALCDRDGGTVDLIPFKAEGNTDFRCPNCLNGWLRGNGAGSGLPLLQAFLVGRLAKRQQRPDPWDYAAKKVFAKAYADLNVDQQNLLRHKMGQGKAVYDREDGWRY